MAEKKVTTKAAPKKAATKTTTTKKTVVKKTLDLSASNAGFKAGDVYQALATAGKALTVAQIAKDAKISSEEVLIGIGWLLKEGKIQSEEDKVTLA